MARTVSEWIGKSDDTPVPPRVRLRVFHKFNSCCAGCGVSLIGRKWTCDHKIALINDGENRETNLQPLGNLCCNPNKNKADVAEKSKTYRVQARHAGVSLRKSRWSGGRDSNLRKKINGQVVNRKTGLPIGRG